MSLQWNNTSVGFQSFKDWTNNFEDLSCLTLDLAKINTKGSFGPTIPILFKDDKGVIHQGLTLFSTYMKHCGNVFGERYSTYTLNIQKYHTPSTIFTKEGEVIREPTEQDENALFIFVERAREHLAKLIDAEVKKGTIRVVGKKGDDGGGKLYVKSGEFLDTPMQLTVKEGNGRVVDINNPMMRLKLYTKDKSSLIFLPSAFSDNSKDELSQKGISLTTENVIGLIPKRTMVRPVCKLGDVRASDKGFMMGLYVNAVAIKRQANTTATCLADSEDEGDDDVSRAAGRISLSDS